MTTNLLFDNPLIFWQGGGTTSNSGLTTPVSRGIFLPPTLGVSPIWRVNKAEYNTRKGNKPSRLLPVVETRHLIERGETTKAIGGITMSQNNSVVAFQFQSKEIRTATKDDGTVWFAAKDVAAALDVKWTGHTLGSIPKSWQGMVKLTTPSGKQELTIISEPAVYKLAFRSNKPEAEAFTNWVAGEVLPAIRKTGRYELPTLTPDQQRKIQQLIGEKVYATGNKKLYPTLFKQIYRSIKDEFHVGKYNQVPVDRFSELVAYVGKVNVGGQEEFNEADQIHMKDIADVADGISNELKTVTKTLFLVQAYVGRVLQDVCVLMPREFAEMKRRKRIAEN